MRYGRNKRFAHILHDDDIIVPARDVFAGMFPAGGPSLIIDEHVSTKSLCGITWCDEIKEEAIETERLHFCRRCEDIAEKKKRK